MIITLGKRGSVYAFRDTLYWQSARRVEAVDTTAAGDTFIGAVCALLCRDVPIVQAMNYGSLCAAITVSRRGAAVSIPTEEEVEQYLQEEERLC